MQNKKEKTIAKVDLFLDKLLTDKPDFYGRVELNFCNGEVPNINVKYSHIFEKPKR